MGNKGNNAGLMFLVIVVIGVGVVAVGFSQQIIPLPLPELQSLSVLLERECDVNTVGFGQINFGDLQCRLIIGTLVDDRLPVVKPLPLTDVDVKSPMTLTLNYVASSQGNPACDATVSDPIVTLSDENGNVIGTPPQGITDIQPLITQGQQTLVITIQGNFDPAVCGDGDVRYNGSLRIDFLQKPPEIEEFTNPLLEQWLYLADFRDQSRIETDQSFAVAESFQLVDPTVITGLRVRIGSDLPTSSQDFDTSITAFVWNLDESPPKRVVQSAETFKGIVASRPEIDIDFTFPNAVALLALENNQQVTYGVGIRVDQNIGQKFIYMQSNQTADTHECVIDRNSQADSESMFVSNGLCGFDIFHSPFKASQILAELPDINDPSLSITQAEIIRILCEGLEPEPDICQIQATPDQCGITEIFFNGECICAPTFDRNAQGDCEITEKNLLPDLLQIAEFSFLLLVIIGGIIIVIGIIGIIIRSRR